MLPGILAENQLHLAIKEVRQGVLVFVLILFLLLSKYKKGKGIK
jgi:hypothetical protein